MSDKLIKTKINTLFILSYIFLMTGCGERLDLAPVDAPHRWRYHQSASVHRVARGETLYSIAFRYDLDYRLLARFNHIKPPYIVRVGQVLQLRSDYLRRPTKQQFIKSSSRPTLSSPTKFSPYPRGSTHAWSWPVRGRVVTYFSPEHAQKGIDIAGHRGEKVYAATNGIVAYAGNGLAGYGNLIIIKHDYQYLTAYANNSRNLVREGQRIKAGQAIAEIGVIDHRFWGVHFEVRQAGKPINPWLKLK